MNGRVSKRIRIAARVMGRPEGYASRVKRLKRDYRQRPYHTRRVGRHRATPPGHSAFLRGWHIGESFV